MADRLSLVRTVTLLGSVLTALSSGTNYVYSAYAPQLGSRLHMTYTQLNIIGSFGNMGKYSTGPVMGRIADKHGPRPLLIASFILLFTGYTGLRSYFDAGPSNDENIPLSSLIAMSMFSFMTGSGGDAGLTSATNATAKSFPDHMRATTVGFVLSGFGLSAFLFSTLAQWFFPGNTSSFLLFLSLGTSLPAIIGYFAIRPIPHAESLNSGIGLDDVGRGITGSESDEDLEINDGPYDVRTIAAYPLFLSGVEDPGSKLHGTELSRLRSDTRRNGSSSQKPVGRTRPSTVSECVDTHGKRMLTGWEFWLLFSMLSLLSGTGLMFINNVGVITQALSAKGNSGYDKVAASKLQTAQVSIISLANCGARLGIGASADYVKTRLEGHRSYLLSLVSLLFVISQIVGSQVENVQHLWIASLLLGLGHGGIFGLLPTITIDWFGMAHFSENWGFVGLAPLLGGNLFSILFGRNLDAHVISTNPRSTTESIDHRGPRPGRQCLEGRACYASTMTVTTFACLLALVLSFVAAWRDRRKKGNIANEYISLQHVIWEDEAEE